MLLTDEILSKAAKEKYYRPALRENETLKSYYAYGWDVMQTDRKTTRIWHNGSNGVFYADFYRFIDEGVSIILMTNKWQSNFNDTGRVISRIIFDPGFEPVLPVADNKDNRALTETLIKLALEKDLKTAIESFRQRDKKTDLLENVVNAKGYDLMSEKKLS